LLWTSGRYLHRWREKSQIGADGGRDLGNDSNQKPEIRVSFQSSLRGATATKQSILFPVWQAWIASLSLAMTLRRNQLAAAAGTSRWCFITILLSAPR
jgi:hypothetical protein